IEALFEISADHPVCGILEEMGLEPEEDLLLIRRDITASGKSTCRINGSPVTLSMLKKVGRSLLDIHGQHEHQSLLRTEEHLEWLDAFGDQSLKDLRREYETLYYEYRTLEKELDRLTSDEREAARRMDLLSYQLQEITAANLVEGEDEELEQERNRLVNAEKLVKGAGDAFEALYGEGRGSDSRPSPFPFSGTPSTRISGSPPDIGRSGHFLPDLTIHPGSRMLPDHARRPAPAFRRIW
ncbi:MAG: hypothetical protein LOD87_14985, partial [Planifilum fulgidum]